MMIRRFGAIVAAMALAGGLWQIGAKAITVSKDLAITVTGVSSAGYYVAASGGSDSNPGTLAAPFATLGKCQSTMRGSSTKTCYLKAGTYSTALVLDTNDNGETWSYYPSDPINTAIISPGTSRGIDSTADNISIIGLRLSLNGNYGIVSQGNGVTIKSALIDGNGVASGSGTGSPIAIVGDGILLENNTLQNVGEPSLGCGGCAGIFIFGGFTNSMVIGNTIQCISSFGIRSGDGGGWSNNVFANNTFRGIGHTSGAPGCAGVTDAAGTGLTLNGSSGTNLFVNNTFSPGIEGYSMSFSANGSGAQLVSDSILTGPGDPALLFNGSNNGVIRRNTLSAPGSVTMHIGDENDAPSIRSNTATGVLVSNNSDSTLNGFPAITLSGTNNSFFYGNSNASSNPPQVGLDFQCWSTINGGSNNNQVIGNSFINSNTIGINFDAPASGHCADAGSVGSGTAGCSNVVRFNVLYPNPTPILNNSGCSQTISNNQITSDASPLVGAPPIANAGPSQTALPGATVTLNGSGTHNITGNVGTITYAWSQILGTSVVLSSTSTQSPTFTAPAVSSGATILGFNLTTSTANGSTFDKVYIGVGRL